MSPRATRLARALAAGAVLTSLASTVHAAGSARPRAASSFTYKIGISLPYNELAELSNGIKQSVQVAVAQANKNHTVPGVTFDIQSLDDTINGQHSGQKDSQNASALINDNRVIGEVGPLNSSAAKVSEPTYNRAGLVQISPSNTNPDLTVKSKRALYEPASAISGAPITYFRTCTTDIIQGRSDARYAKKAGFKNIFVTDNQGIYGIGLSNYFEQEAKTLGLNVLGHSSLDAQNISASAQSLATTIASKKPDLVFFGGEYGSKGGAEILADDLRSAGLSKVVFMGGDGIFATDFIKGSSKGGAQGALASNVGRNALTSPYAQSFVAAKKAQFPGSSIEGYDIYAYDAANVIIRAFAKAVKGGQIKVGNPMTVALRQTIARNVAGTSDYRGATGQVSFDKNGDSSNRDISVYRASGTGASAKWTFVALAPAAS
jgi:branched-chain amino acid transport system substrate-binding protein